MTDIIKYARNSSISGEQRQISPIPGLTRHFWTDAESFPSREISPIRRRRMERRRRQKMMKKGISLLQKQKSMFTVKINQNYNVLCIL